MTKNYKSYLLSMLGIGLSLNSTFAMEEHPLPQGSNPRLSSAQSEIDHISTLPDELKQNILARLAPKSIAAISEMSWAWYNQTHDKHLIKVQENYFQTCAQQTGITSKYNPIESWKETYIHRNDKEWVLESFKKGVDYFVALEKENQCHIGDGTLHAGSLGEILRTDSDQNVLDHLKVNLSLMIGLYDAHINYNLKNNLRFQSWLGKHLMRELVGKKDSRILNFLYSKHVKLVNNLTPQEVLSFCAHNEIPVLVPNSISNSRQRFLADKNDTEVISAIHTCIFFDSIRQFIKDYSRFSQESPQPPLHGIHPQKLKDTGSVHQGSPDSQQKLPKITSRNLQDHVRFYTQLSQPKQIRTLGMVQPTHPLNQQHQPKQYASYMMGQVKSQVNQKHLGGKPRGIQTHAHAHLNFYQQFSPPKQQKEKK